MPSSSSKRRRKENKAAAQQDADNVKVSAVPCGRPSRMERSIDQLTAPELDTLSAELWVMSPPCQPHTRNNKSDKRDVDDPRYCSYYLSISYLFSIINSVSGVQEIGELQVVVFEVIVAVAAKVTVD